MGIWSFPGARQKSSRTSYRVGDRQQSERGRLGCSSQVRQSHLCQSRAPRIRYGCRQQSRYGHSRAAYACARAQKQEKQTNRGTSAGDPRKHTWNLSVGSHVRDYASVGSQHPYRQKLGLAYLTGEQLKEAGISLFGERGWQSSLALHLGIDRTQIWRYVTNNSVPGPVAAAVECWIKNGPPEKK